MHFEGIAIARRMRQGRRSQPTSTKIHKGMARPKKPTALFDRLRGADQHSPMKKRAIVTKSIGCKESIRSKRKQHQNSDGNNHNGLSKTKS